MGALPKERPQTDASGDDGGIERPTLRPPFDPETFARESESRLPDAEPASCSRPTPRALHRPEAPPLELRPTRTSVPSAPDIDERPAKCDALDALGQDAVPVLMVPREELESIVLPSEAHHLLACVDGFRPLETVCTMAGMRAQDGATILLELADQGVVSFR
jgi:hypothetical protein